MAFTGSPVLTMITDGICRITGISLAPNASGTISLQPGAGQVKIPAQMDAKPYELFGHLVGLNESLDITVAPVATLPGAGGAAAGDSAMFFGTTTGTGSLGNDYAATVLAGAAVPFPRNDGATVGGPIVRSGVSTTQFLCNVTGLYSVAWTVDFVEASQLQLAVNGVAVASTCASSVVAGGINTNRVLLALNAGDLVTLINPAGNGTALTVAPAAGALTHAQAPSLVFTAMNVATGSGSGVPTFAIAKVGSDEAAFLATITNTGPVASPGLEIYVEFHT